MYTPCFAIGQFNGPWDRRISDKAIAHLLEALVQINMDYLRENPGCPDLNDAGIYYRRVIPPGQQDDYWADIPTCLTLGYADCEDFVAWRVAELRMKGIDARCGAQWHEKERLYHIFVVLPDGKTEDPSRTYDDRGYFAVGAEAA